MKIHKTEKAMLKQQAKDNRKRLTEMLDDLDEGTLTADGFDAAIVGITESFPIRVIYDHDTCIRVLMSEGMSEEDALEHFTYNVAGSHVGEQTPVFIHPL
jgi:preprotein translocase subunit YajC